MEIPCRQKSTDKYRSRWTKFLYLLNFQFQFVVIINNIRIVVHIRSPYVIDPTKKYDIGIAHAGFRVDVFYSGGPELLARHELAKCASLAGPKTQKTCVRITNKTCTVFMPPVNSTKCEAKSNTTGDRTLLDLMTEDFLRSPGHVI